MLARDIMTKEVVTVSPATPVTEIAKILIERRISAVPVVDADQRVLGIISEGDLMQRQETGTEPHRSWWLALLTLPEDDARRFVKNHGKYARDVMSSDVIAVGDDRPVGEIAALLERKRIKRVPVTCDGILAGIVSRADLLRGLATSKPPDAPSPDDAQLREAVEDAIRDHEAAGGFASATVRGGIVHLWGAVEDVATRDAVRVAAENVPGVVSVEDEMTILPPNIRAFLGSE